MDLHSGLAQVMPFPPFLKIIPCLIWEMLELLVISSCDCSVLIFGVFSAQGGILGVFSAGTGAGL